MKRKIIIDLIYEISSFKNAFEILEDRLKKYKKSEIMDSLIETGVMPEIFEHDSSEEKLWAKYSDILLARVLTFLGIPAEVIRMRGDSADVLGKNSSYSIVGDAKTFRLSRTAKNQKDFKINALDDWRRSNDYALLVGPLSQFPSNRSQIYLQAIERNVTLISYVHLNFLLQYHDKNQSLEVLWQTGQRLYKSKSKTELKNAVLYWNSIDQVICEIVGINIIKLKDLKRLEKEKRKQLGLEGINYWQAKINDYKNLNREEAIKRLIKASKIEAKIVQIRKAVERECIL